MNEAMKGAWLMTADGTLQQTEVVAAVAAQAQAAKAAEAEVDRAWAGALFAKMFAERAWLMALTVSFWVSDEYNDMGGTFRTVSVSVSDVVLKTTAQDAGEGDEDAMDEVAAEYDLQGYLEDNAYSLYSTLLDEDSYDDLKFSIRREQLSELLNRERIDGAEVFTALLPIVGEATECVA